MSETNSFLDQFSRLFLQLKRSTLLRHSELSHNEMLLMIQLLRHIMPPSSDPFIMPVLEPPQEPTPPVAVAKILQSMHLSKSAVSQLLNHLEEREYLVRTIDPKDRRRIAISITPLGLQTIWRIHRRSHWLLQRILQDMGEQDTRELLRLMERMLQVAEAIDMGQFDIESDRSPE